MSMSSNEGWLTIGELAARTGASRRSLRYYETLGLLRAERASNGYRSYGMEATDVVHRIQNLIRLGVPLRSAGPLLRCVRRAELEVLAPCQPLREILTRELVRIEGLQVELSRRRQQIMSLLSEAAGQTPDPTRCSQ